MKNFTLYLICTITLSTFFAFNAFSQELNITRNGNLRSGPSTQHEIIGKVTSGMKVIQIKKAEEWYNIRLTNQNEGWIHSILITKTVVDNFKTGEIHKATKENDIEKIRELISNDANINAQDEQKRTALHWAVEEDYNDIAILLLDAGADVNIKDKWSGGNTPIEYSVFSIKSWNEKNNYSMEYTRNGMGDDRLWNKELFNILLKHDAYVNPKRLLLKAVSSNDIQLLNLIVSKWKISVPNKDGRYVYYAVVRGAHESLKWLIEKGAEINQPCVGGFTPLHIAAMHGNKKSIEILMKAGAHNSLTIKDDYGRTPIDFAKEEKVYYLMEKYRSLSNIASENLDDNREVGQNIVSTQGDFKDVVIGPNGELLMSGEGIIQSDKGSLIYSLPISFITPENITLRNKGQNFTFAITANTLFCKDGIRATWKSFNIGDVVAVTVINEKSIATNIRFGPVLFSMNASSGPKLEYYNCESSKSKINKEKPESNMVVNDSIKVTLGAFILNVPSDWASFDQSEISNLKSQYQEQSKQIYQEYAVAEDGSESIDLAAYHISKDAGIFTIVSFSVPPQSDLITLLKSQIGDKMDWGISEGYIQKYLGIVEVENEQFLGFYTKAVGKTGEIEISGGLEHKELKNTIIQLTLLCPKEWDSTMASNTMDALLKTVILKNK